MPFRPHRRPSRRDSPAEGLAPSLPLQLETLRRELEACSEQVRALAERLDEARFLARPAAGAWSPAECVVHLTRTNRAYLPVLQSAIAEGIALGRAATAPYRTDLLGRLLIWIMEPPSALRSRTAAAFVPGALAAPAVVLADFLDTQRELASLLPQAARVDLSRLRIRSPFDPRVRYNAWSALCLLTAHQRRHLWQARRAAEGAAPTD